MAVFNEQVVGEHFGRLRGALIICNGSVSVVEKEKGERLSGVRRL